MSQVRRIALIVDPFTTLTRGGHHARGWAEAAIAAGHAVKGFGASAERLPSSPGLATEEARTGADRGAGVIAFEPELIVAYDALSPAAWLGARCARRLSVPLVLVEPGSYAPGSFFERALWRLGESFWGRAVRRQMSALVALDEHAARRAADEGFDERLIEIVEPGVDTQAFRPGLASPLVVRHKIRGRMLLYVGRVSEERGLRRLLAAFSQTIGRSGDWSLVIAGAGDLHGALRAQSEQCGVSASVHLLPKIAEEDLPGLYASATLVAVPAPTNVVRGISVLRAMAAGRPVLVGSAARLASVITHEETGFVVDTAKTVAWAAALRRAASAPAARKRWGETARELACLRLAWPQVLTRFEEVFQRAGQESERRARIEAERAAS